jgi:hypothetical protein
MEYVKKYRFWIVVGLLVVVSGVVFAVGFLPTREQNAQKMAEWRSKAQDARDLAKKDQRTEGDVEQAQELKGEYQQDWNQLRSMLAERVKMLDQYIPDPQTGRQAPLEGGDWKFVYTGAMEALEDEICKSFGSAASPLIEVKDYATIWPEPVEMRAQATNYWLQRYLLQALASVNDVRTVVPSLEGFGFRTSVERVLHPAHSEFFTPVGFTLDVTAKFGDIPVVLDHLLRCEVPVSVTSIAVSREGAGSGRGAAGAAARPSAGRSRRRRSGPPAIDFGAQAAARAREAAERARREAMARVGRTMPTGPTGPGVRGRPTGPTGPLAPTAPAVPEPAQTERPTLVSVSIRGYILQPAGE